MATAPSVKLQQMEPTRFLVLPLHDQLSFVK